MRGPDGAVLTSRETAEHLAEQWNIGANANEAVHGPAKRLPGL